MERIEEILTFWFGAIEDGLPVENRTKLWFRSNVEGDKLIRERFEADLQSAAAGLLDSWARTPRGRLALIVLLDQFSRNIYRGTAKAFSQDERAVSLCLTGIDIGHDLMLTPIERVFFYFPLEHAENLDMQEKSVALIKSLLESVSSGARPKLQSFLGHAIDHRDIVKRFGRFPHRNKVLKRRSTPKELAFLDAGRSSFGQG